MAAWRQALLRAWAQRGLLAWLLWPLSLLYRAAFRLRHGLYALGALTAQRLPVPVIVVGNVMAGGTGKTPVVMALAKHLKARGLHPGVISRGYGRTTDDCREVRPESVAAEVGDEPLLVARATGVPVFVARNRCDAARQLLAHYPETAVIVADDGLQHWALARDIELCLFDDRGTGNGFLLPAGPLREPWPRAVDMVVHTGDQPAFAGWRARRALAAEAVQADGTRLRLSALVGKPLTALAGIAHPEAFFAMLRATGLTLTHAMGLPDHYDFDSGSRSWDAGCSLICTEKDAVKLWRVRPDAWAVPLELAFDPGFHAALDQLLDAKLSSRHGSQTA